MGVKVKKNAAFFWIGILSIIIIIKIFASNEGWVESFYSLQFYYYFSQVLRFLFGWISFSVGDVLYFLAGGWIIYRIVKAIVRLAKGKVKGKGIFASFVKFIIALLIIYIVFNIFWGINYNRKSIASQLGLTELNYDTSDVRLITQLLAKKVNATKAVVDAKGADFPDRQLMFNKAAQSYAEAEKTYSFLSFHHPSLKSSLYGWWGNYLGFTGYYNPFTGEAQVNTTVPNFLQPFIATHEMAHQLGYAKESTANFVGYLASVHSKDTLFHYSAYLDLLLYAARELSYFDSTGAVNTLKELSPSVRKDLEIWRQFNQDHRSFIEPLINWMYGNFLKLNQQPSGLRSYNEVVGLLISYYKQFGKI